MVERGQGSQIHRKQGICLDPERYQLQLICPRREGVGARVPNNLPLAKTWFGFSY